MSSKISSKILASARSQVRRHMASVQAGADNPDPYVPRWKFSYDEGDLVEFRKEYHGLSPGDMAVVVRAPYELFGYRTGRYSHPAKYHVDILVGGDLYKEVPAAYIMQYMGE